MRPLAARFAAWFAAWFTVRAAAAAAVAAIAGLVLGAGACRGASEDQSGPCRCTPGNVSRTRAIDEEAPMDGPALLARLRHHQRLVEAGTNPRDVKVFDDELRYAILDFCQPCSAWVGERMTMEEMFPLHRLGDAKSAVCMGLVLRDGTIAYGDARPRACR
jgi:hypothetical protein